MNVLSDSKVRTGGVIKDSHTAATQAIVCLCTLLSSLSQAYGMLHFLCFCYIVSDGAVQCLVRFVKKNDLLHVLWEVKF